MNLDLIYLRVPDIKCQGKCSESCGPIMADDAEVQQFEKRTGKPFPDAIKMLESLQLTCPHLNVFGRCDVYANRPLICRLWGVAETMPCPWGCRPERVFSEREARSLMDEIAELGVK